MSLRGALMAAILLGLGGLGLVAWIGLQLPAHPRAAAAAEPPPNTRILVAAHPLRAGDLLKYDDLEAREVPADQLPAGATVDSAQARADMVGSMLRRGLLPREALQVSALLRPGEHGFLAAVLRPGMRATTVGVDAVSGTAGLIWPGDHVDVIMTQVSDDQSLPAARRASAQTVLGDVRVIAIDQQLIQGGNTLATGQNAAHTVTLEVTEIQAERVALAARLGHLSFIVRAADAPPEPIAVKATTTWGGDVSSALGDAKPAGRVMKVYQGTAEARELHF